MCEYNSNFNNKSDIYCYQHNKYYYFCYLLLHHNHNCINTIIAHHNGTITRQLCLIAGTLSVVYLVAFVAIKAANWGINIDLWDKSSISYSPWIAPSFPATSGMLGLSYLIHNIIITVMRNNRHQENNVSVPGILFTLHVMVKESGERDGQKQR